VENGAPEFLHVYGALEHNEDVSVIVGVEFLAFGAKVLSAEGTAVPLSDNAKQVPVAKRERMGKVAQIS
jgi:quinolinate synthase